MIKSFTDLEQSKKLAEFLSPESADMYYDYDVQKHEYYPMIMDDQFDDTCVRAWSLAALLSVLSEYTLESNKYYGKVALWYKSISVECENPVDACVAMIEKLHELNLL